MVLDALAQRVEHVADVSSGCGTLGGRRAVGLAWLLLSGVASLLLA